MCRGYCVKFLKLLLRAVKGENIREGGQKAIVSDCRWTRSCDHDLLFRIAVVLYTNSDLIGTEDRSSLLKPPLITRDPYPRDIPRIQNNINYVCRWKVEFGFRIFYCWSWSFNRVAKIQVPKNPWNSEGKDWRLLHETRSKNCKQCSQGAPAIWQDWLSSSFVQPAFKSVYRETLNEFGHVLVC